jgi:hypothetical protein
MFQIKSLNRSATLLVALTSFAAGAFAQGKQAANGCAALPNYAALKTALDAATMT